MSDRPTSRRFAAPRLLVMMETSPDSGEYAVDKRASVVELLRTSDDQISQARLQIYAGEIGSTTAGTEEKLSIATWIGHGPRADFAQYLHPDQRMMVVREDQAIGDADPVRTILFSGFCDDSRFDQVHQKQSHRGIEVLIEGVWKWQAHQTQSAQICGRYMRSASAAEDLALYLVGAPYEAGTIPEPFGEAADVKLCEALPCVFNPKGKGNRSRHPVTVMIDEQEELLHVFTFDEDPDAEMWTLAQALRYLELLHVYEVFGDGATEDLAGYVQDGNVLLFTSGQISTSDEEDAPLICEASVTDRPESPVDPTNALEYALLGVPTDFEADMKTVGEVFNLLRDAAGIHYRVTTSDDGEGKPVDRLFVWARGSGEQKDFSLYASPSDRGRPASELLSENDIKAMSLRVDYSDVLQTPRWVGDVYRHEVTVELVPGWEPDENVDAVAIMTDALDYAKAHVILKGADLAADPWYSRYHTLGSSFIDYRRVGRFWVLNEDGGFRPEVYGRELGSRYDAEAYAAWTPDLAGIKKAVISSDGTVSLVAVAADDWVRRTRPLQQAYSSDADKKSIGIVVEVSVDDWTTAIELDATIVSLGDRAGVRITTDDLVALKPWKNTETPPTDSQGDPLSFWAAIVEDRLRVRVTAVIDGDDRCGPGLDTSKYATISGATRLFDCSDKFKVNDWDNANSVFGGRDPIGTLECTEDVRNDLVKFQRMAENSMELASARVQPGSITTPWMTEDFKIGDCIRAIGGLAVVFYSNLDAGVQHYPDIVAVKTTQGDTTVVLEDLRELERITGGKFQVG